MTSLEPEPGDGLLPDGFGDYRVVALLGEGGMGTVYEAEQQHPKRRVALKVIRAGLASAEVLRRFEHEAAVLARLQHPGIAQIHEAGTFTAADGARQPYFAMELVRGLPLTTYASARALDTRQRLELVVGICAAVEHAHQRGIIHRDLKPANILVDESGQPKILDFGLARLTDSDVQAATMLTDLGQMVGTLPYMSPEQASGEPGELDTRSDVYALGVIAYELLSGRLPHDVRKQMLLEALRAIREDQPSRLSTFDRNLRGDVETIVGKALEKDKTRRYQSAGELGSDIQRHLRHEAISARPASTFYQLAKFARRNRVLVGGVLATLAALAAGLVVSSIQYDRAADARDLAEERRQQAADARDLAEERRQQAADARDLAEAARQQAVDSGDESRAINAFLIEMLASADLARLGRDARVSQALDAASAAIAASFVDRPRVEVGIREILASTYISLGMFDEAEPHAQRTLELATQLATELDGEENRWLALGLQRTASCLAARGDHAAAAARLREAVEAAERCCGPESILALDTRANLANELRELGDSAESEAIYRSVLALRRDSGGRELQATLNGLAVLLHEAGRPAEAAPLYRESADLIEQLNGPDDPDALVTRFNLAPLMDSLGDHEQAQALMAETLLRIRAVFGDAHIQTATAMRALGGLCRRLGKPQQALPLLQESVAILVRVQGERSLGVAEYKHTLAAVQLELGDYPAAARTFRDVVDIFAENGKAIEDAAVLEAMSGLAQALSRSGRDDQAEPLYREVIEVSSRVFGPDDKTTIVAINSLAVLLQGSGRHSEAEPLLEQTLAALVRAYPPDDRDTAVTTHNLMWVKSALGHAEEAAAQVPDVLRRFELAFGPRHPSTAQVHSAAALMLRDVGRLDEAEEQCRIALELRRDVFGERHVTVGLSLELLGELLLARGDAAGALPHLEAAASILEDAPDVSDLAYSRSLLGESLTKLMRYAEAEPLLLEGQRAIEAAPYASDADERQAIERLVDLYSAWQSAAPSDERARQLHGWQARLDALDAPR